MARTGVILLILAVGMLCWSQQPSSAAHGRRLPTLTPQRSGTTNRLQAVSPVNARVVWASGLGGTYAMTEDGGETWRAGVVPGAEKLEFRDVEGVSESVAYLLSSGNGASSRIYKTEDGGKSWLLQFQNHDPKAFYDCFAFWSREAGLAMSDSVGARFPAMRTTDGATWQDIGGQLPAAQDGEGAFAASGTCVAVFGGKRAWIATGSAAKARVFATTDRGKKWAAYDTPVLQGAASRGGFSIAFRDAQHGVLGGGDNATPKGFADTVARTADGGKTWKLTSRTPFPGAVYGLSYARPLRPGKGRDAAVRIDEKTIVVTGPSGAAWSGDEGHTWSSLPGISNCWAVAFATPQAGWLVCTEGRIVKISF